MQWLSLIKSIISMPGLKTAEKPHNPTGLVNLACCIGTVFGPNWKTSIPYVSAHQKEKFHIYLAFFFAKIGWPNENQFKVYYLISDLYLVGNECPKALLMFCLKQG